ncbi:MAG: hypothetical protein ACXU9B_23865, partial [Reyranella sp.]
GLEVAPPLAGQVGFLEGLDSIDEEQFRQALRKLEQRRAPAPAAAPAPAISEAAATALAAEPSPQPAAPSRPRTRAAAAAPAQGAIPDGLLLKDATLEDIVRFLHEKNIEPTFRFLPPR